MPDASTVPNRRRWISILGWCVLALAFLLIVLYFVVTSSIFFKGVVLPKVGKSLNVNITAADASISPFSRVVLHQIKVQTTGSEPLLAAQEVRLVYHLGDILGGNYHVEEITILSPTVSIVTLPDGASNLDPLLKKSAPPKPVSSTPPSQRSATLKIDINKISLSNATVRVIKEYAGGGRDLTEASSVNFSLENLRNGGSGKLTLAANLGMDQGASASHTNAALAAALAGNFTFSLAPDLRLGSLNGSTHLSVQKGTGSFSDAAGLSASLDCDITPTEIKQAALRFQKAGANLGELRASGPFNLAQSEGRVQVSVTGIDRQVLNLFGAKLGIDFGPATINSTNQIESTKGGSLISASGRFAAADLALKQGDTATPTLDFRSQYDVLVNRGDNSALLRKFQVTGSQNKQPLLQADLTRPMGLAWGGGSNAVGDSALNLTVTNFNLAQWKPLFGNRAPTGTANLTLRLLSEQAGKQLTAELSSQIENLTAGVGTNEIQGAEVVFRVHGQVRDLHQIDLSECRLQAAQAGRPLVAVSGSAQYDLGKKSGQLALNLVDLNENALRPFLATALGTKKLVSVSVKGTTTTSFTSEGGASFKADLQMTNLVVSGPNQPASPPLEASLKAGASLAGRKADLHECLIALTPTARATNQLNLTGQMDMTRTDAIQGALKLAAESLDMTRYYEIFAAKTDATKGIPPATPFTPAIQSQPAVATEPAPMNLPFQEFSLDASVSRFYLREVEITNFQTAVKLNGSRITVKPFQLGLNGAPVSANVDLNLGVPGYQYDLSLTADKIPLAPLVDSFSSKYEGHAKGDFIANAQIKGAGITGPSMQKNLSGQVSLAFTNANIELVGPKVKLIVTPIATALQLPELIRSPITWLTADAIITNGVINLQQFKAVGSALEAGSQGTITIADVLTNSTINNLPVELSLPTSLALKAHLASANANTNSPYVNLGKIATVSGTVGNPKTKTDYAAIGLLTTRAIAGVPGAVGGKVGSVFKDVEGLSGILTGKNPKNTNQPASTNAPSGNPFDFLRKVIPK